MTDKLDSDDSKTRLEAMTNRVAELESILHEFNLLVNLLLCKSGGRFIVSQSDLLLVKEIRPVRVCFDGPERRIIYEFADSSS